MRGRRHVSLEPESEEDEVLKVAETEQRGQVAMFTWPTPKEYFMDLQDRLQAKMVIPTDVSRDQLLEVFKRVMDEIGFWPHVCTVLIAMEPHRRMKPDGSGREQHYHLVWKMNKNFAHKTFVLRMKEQGIHGFVSKSLRGWLQYCEYLLCETPRKLAQHRDPAPLLYPNSGPDAIQTLKDLIKTDQNRQAALHEEVTGNPLRNGNKKRRALEWWEVINLVVENKLETEADWWLCAKKYQDEHGENLMFNYFDRVRMQTQGVQKTIDNAWKHHRASMGIPFVSGYPLQTRCKYPLESFMLNNVLKDWMSKEARKKSLILRGPGGIGKTQMAQAMLSAVCGRFFLCDSFEQTNKCSWTGREGILYDDVHMHDRGIDECKGLLDVEESRVVKCRYEDGYLPAGTPRIFSTNHTKAEFFPRDYLLLDHQFAIDRRHVWVEVAACIRPECIEEMERDHKAADGDLPGATMAYEEEEVFSDHEDMAWAWHEAWAREDQERDARRRAQESLRQERGQGAALGGGDASKVDPVPRATPSPQLALLPITTATRRTVETKKPLALEDAKTPDRRRKSRRTPMPFMLAITNGQPAITNGQPAIEDRREAKKTKRMLLAIEDGQLAVEDESGHTVRVPHAEASTASILEAFAIGLQQLQQMHKPMKRLWTKQPPANQGRLVKWRLYFKQPVRKIGVHVVKRRLTHKQPRPQAFK